MQLRGKRDFDTFLQRWAQPPCSVNLSAFRYRSRLPRLCRWATALRRQFDTFSPPGGINLPEGSENDPEEADTVHALGERKTRLFRQSAAKRNGSGSGRRNASRKAPKSRHQDGPRLIEQNHTSAILHAARLEHHFDVCIDGLYAEALRLPGKPDLALFLEVARRLNVHPSRIMPSVRGVVGRGRSWRTGQLPDA